MWKLLLAKSRPESCFRESSMIASKVPLMKWLWVLTLSHLRGFFLNTFLFQFSELVSQLSLENHFSISSNSSLVLSFKYLWTKLNYSFLTPRPASISISKITCPYRNTTSEPEKALQERLRSVCQPYTLPYADVWITNALEDSLSELVLEKL